MELCFRDEAATCCYSATSEDESWSAACDDELCPIAKGATWAVLVALSPISKWRTKVMVAAWMSFANIANFSPL
jgi:hypothetical protein